MTQTIPLAADARDRFLLEIAKAVPAERIDEVHFFPPIRSGPLETGIAVIAALPDSTTAPFTAEDAEVVPAEDSPYAADSATPVRHVVYSARYRWTRKGPDRGKWESEIVAEADAPLVTVEAVVQGVMKRSPEAFEPERVEGDAVRSMIIEADRRCQNTP